MLDLKRLKKAGLRSGNNRWFGRLLRRLLWPLLKPYFERLIIEIEQLPQSPSALPARKDLLALDAQRKDLTALAHRLASIEEALQRIQSIDSAMGKDQKG